MKVLDTHGNYGTVVRFTPGEWEAFNDLVRAATEEEDE